MSKIILFVGAPGSGKGSRGEECKEHGYIHISSSKLLEDNGFDLSGGGVIVPDLTTMRLLNETIKSYGKKSKIIIDGFPRQLQQAKLLSQYYKVDQVLYFQISKEIALERVKNRIICPICKRPYNANYRPPVVDGICDECGIALVKRASDTEEIFCKRFKKFERKTLPVIEYYKSKGICVKTVNAEEDFDVVSILENKDEFA